MRSAAVPAVGVYDLLAKVRNPNQKESGDMHFWMGFIFVRLYRLSSSLNLVMLHIVNLLLTAPDFHRKFGCNLVSH